MSDVEAPGSDLFPRGQPQRSFVSPERVAGQQRVRASMREMAEQYTATGQSLIACSGCVTIIPRGEAFALHYNPVRMVGQIHCLTCYDADVDAQKARYQIVQEVRHE